MAASVSKSLWWKLLESSPNIPDKAMFKKGTFLLVWYSLKHILGSERKRLSRHQLLY